MRSPITHSLEVASSITASSLRAWRGTMALYHTPQPARALQLFDLEGSPECRPVREALSELDLDVEVYPCPTGGTRHAAKARALGGGDRLPVLHDPNASMTLTGTRDVLEHLFRRYASRGVPRRFRGGLASSRAATAARGNRGMRALASARAAEKPLELYSFESSPFSRLVRERLAELELPYFLHNLGKEQIADIGMPGLRLTLKRYAPKPGGKRAALLECGGKVQVPYLVDPNDGGRALYESRDILDYLDARFLGAGLRR